MSVDLNIKDDSNDRKYFTIVPNFILNHSTAIDQALYLQMKRVAGDNGLCFITQKHLCERLGIGKDKLRASFIYLLKHKWITYVGTTESKTRPINTYRVNDIWKQNSDFYQVKKIRPETDLSSEAKDKTQKAGDKTQNSPMIRPRTDPILRTNINKINKKKYSSIKDIGEVEFSIVANQYRVPLSLVRSSYEDLINYCSAHGRRYKNYLAALRNFVKKDTGVNGIIKRPEPKNTEMPKMTPVERSKARKKIAEIRGNLVNKLSIKNDKNN